MTKKIRIKDIAAMAKVSVGTVDRVIHNRGEVAKESYDKIMTILERTGYKPNLIAKTLGSNRTYNIVAFLPDPRQDEYWSLSSAGLKEAESEWQQYGIQIEAHYFDLYDEKSFLKISRSVFRKGRPDAILLPPVFYKESLEVCRKCEQLNIPFVLFNNNIPEANPLTFVGQDLHLSGRVGAELLHKSEKRPGVYAILHIYDDIHSSLHLSEKERGFKDYFDEVAGNDVTVRSLDLNFKHKKSLEKEITNVLSEQQLRGVLVTTSKGASIVSQLLQKHGKNGIKLVAYDLLKENIDYLNKGIIDLLINQNSRKQALTGVGKLANRLLFNKATEKKELFPLEIITKENLKSYVTANQDRLPPKNQEGDGGSAKVKKDRVNPRREPAY